MSDSNRGLIRYISEVTLGTTPVNGTWQLARFTGESLSATVVTTQSNEIRSDRLISDMPKTNLTVGGGLDIELSATTYDDFIEAALCGTWASDVLKVGVVDRSFSIEKEFADLSRFASFAGMRVGQMSLSMAFGAIITGSFTFAGTGSDTATTSLVGTGSTTAATTTEVLNASSDVGTVKIDDVATDICIQTITLDVTNNLRERGCIGNDAPSDQRKGTSTVTGTVEMYMDVDAWALYEKALANTAISLEYTVTDGVNSYTFLIPKAKLAGDTPTIDGLDTDVMFTATFTALADAVEGTNLKITRV